MKKAELVKRTIIQIIIYLIEVVGMSFLITYWTHQYIEEISTYMEFLERILLSYTIYQILVVVILNNINDIIKDSALAYMTTLKYCLLYLENKDDLIKSIVLERIDKQLDYGMFNTQDIIKAYKILKDNINIVNEKQIQLELINAEHLFEMATLNWRYSFLLRLSIFK